MTREILTTFTHHLLSWFLCDLALFQHTLFCCKTVTQCLFFLCPSCSEFIIDLCPHFFLPMAPHPSTIWGNLDSWGPNVFFLTGLLLIAARWTAQGQDLPRGWNACVPGVGWVIHFLVHLYVIASDSFLLFCLQINYIIQFLSNQLEGWGQLSYCPALDLEHDVSSPMLRPHSTPRNTSSLDFQEFPTI